MKGYLADQKQVLVFQPDHNGKSFLASFEEKGVKLADLHDALLHDGLTFHTLQPAGKDSATVFVHGDDQKTLNAIGKAAGRYGASADIIRGNGEFLGTKLDTGSDGEQRDDARAEYQKVIDAVAASGELPGRDIGGAWNDIRNYWSRLEAAGQVGASTARPSVPGYSPGVKARGKADANAAKLARVDASPFKGDKIEQAMAAAVPAQVALADAGRAIEKAPPGVTFKNPGVKTFVGRILDKFHKYDDNAARISDLAHATFIVSHPAQAEQIAAMLGKQFGVAVEPWRALPQLYTDRTLNIRFPNGLIGEVQMMDPDMARAKSHDGGGGHDMYAEQRKLDPQKQPDRWNQIQRDMQSLYGKVLQNAFWQEARKQGIDGLA